MTLKEKQKLYELKVRLESEIRDKRFVSIGIEKPDPNESSSYRSYEDAVYSTEVEYRYIRTLLSHFDICSVRHSNEHEDMTFHFDVNLITDRMMSYYDDVKTVRFPNRHTDNTNYSISRPNLDTMKKRDPETLLRCRLVLERYDENGNPRNSFWRFDWCDILEHEEQCIECNGGLILFKPYKLIELGIDPETVEPDVA